MPRKQKPKRNTADLLADALRDLQDAQKRVRFYQDRLEPLRQKLIAELAATGGPLQRAEGTIGISGHGVEIVEIEPVPELNRNYR